MAVTIEPLIAALKAGVPFSEVRPSSNATYLEATLSREQLARCSELLVQHFGAPTKKFGQLALFGGKTARVVKRVGGIRMGQCLFLSRIDGQSAVYATLWPWSSDPARITLKVGVVVE